MATREQQVSINVRWARNANHRLIALSKEEYKDWDAIHVELTARFGLMRVARSLKRQE